MPTLRSSVLIVGDLKEKFSFDIDCVNSFQEAHCQLQNDSAAIYSVFILPAQNDSEELETFLRKIGKQSPDSQIILVANQIETHRVLEISNQYTIFKLVDSTQKSDLEKPIQEALEEFALIQQNNQLALLIQEQNEKLKHLHRELEDRVEKRQNFLNDARKKLLQTTERVHTLREALVAVHKASSLGELETLLNKVLSESLRLSWTRIFFHPQDNIFQNQKSLQLSFSLFQAPLFKGSEQIGSIYFLRKPEDPFSKNDTDFLLRVAEAVSLALDRLAKMEQSESLKQQWETTFNALSVPVSLIDEKYEIKQCNQSFLTASKKNGIK